MYEQSIILRIVRSPRSARACVFLIALLLLLPFFVFDGAVADQVWLATREKARARIRMHQDITECGIRT